MQIDEEIIKNRKNLGKEKKSLDTLYNLLKMEKPDGVTPEFIVETIMKMRGVRGQMAEKMALMHIGDDPRFDFTGGVFKLKGKLSATELFNAPSYCAVDIETTGLSPKEPEGAIIEIAAVRIVNGELKETFCELVNPGFTISEDPKTNVSGITNAMIKGAPAIEDVLPRFLDFIGDSIFVAHNAPFDLGFINESLSRKYYQKMVNPIICTLKLSRMVFPNLESHSLESVMRVFKLTSEKSHRALDDAKACAKILVNLLNIIKNSGSLK